MKIPSVLARAEKIDNKGSKILTSWGTVGMLPNPECKDNMLVTVLDSWKARFQDDARKEKFDLPVAPTEKPVITGEGFFEFVWPAAVDEMPLDFDIILATATAPTLTPDYPSVNEVADAWIYNTGRYEQYFFKNVEYGIRTYQDVAIWQRISQMKPEWRSDYSVAIEKLGG